MVPVLVAWLAVQAAAQEPTDAKPDADEAPAGGVEEIVVRSTAGEEFVFEDMPSSTTSFDMEDLRAQGTSDIRGLAAFTPNLEIKSVFAASNPTLFIRGVGLKDYFANSSSAVAVYNDDLYMNSPTGQLFQLFDLEAVEVLRGPQGTLYGRNASAGVIRAISRKPTGRNYNAFVSGSYGSYDLIELESALEVPIVEDTLSFRGAYRLNKRDGITKNRCAQGYFRFQPPCSVSANRPFLGDVEEDVNDVDNWAARGIFRWTPTHDLDVLMIAGGGLNRSLARQNQKIGTVEDALDRKVAGNPDSVQYRDPDTCTPGKCIRILPGFRTTPGEANPLDGDPYEGDYDITPDEDVDVVLSTLTVKYEPGALGITSVTGYASNARDSLNNSDSSPRFQVEADWENEAWQFSEDLRATWDVSDELLLTSGAYFLTEDLDVDNTFEFPSFSDTGRTTVEQIIDQETLTWSVFGHGAWEITEDLRAEGGIRYNWDEKDFTADSNRRFGTIFFKGPIESQDEISSASSGDLSLHYDFYRDFSIYAKYGRGFKAGQFNGSAGLGNFEIPLVQFVEPETVNAYEVGLKTDFLRRRVRFSAAMFFYRYEDLQVFVLDNSVATLPTPRLVNANDAQVWGAEAELRVRPFHWLDIYTNLGYLESEYLDFRDTVNTVVTIPTTELIKTVVDYSGNRLINSPQLSVSGAITIDIPLGGWGSLTPRFDYSFKSRVYFDPNEGRGQFGFFPRETLSQEPLLLLNARLAYRTPDQKIEVAGFVRNLTDEAYIVDGFDLSAGFNSLTFVIGDPRIIGVNMSYRF